MNSKKVYVDEDLKELIPMFLNNRTQDIERLKELLEKNNLARIKELGHDIKGVGGGYGFKKVTEFGRKLEKAAENEDLSKLQELIVELEDYLEEVEIIYE